MPNKIYLTQVEEEYILCLTIKSHSKNILISYMITDKLSGAGNEKEMQNPFSLAAVNDFQTSFHMYIVSDTFPLYRSQTEFFRQRDQYGRLCVLHGESVDLRETGAPG